MAALVVPTLEHLTPHDLVTYSRCPHEMELHRSERASQLAGSPVAPKTPIGTRPEARSPLFSPPGHSVQVFEGRIDFGPLDRLVYVDAGERGLPVLFAPEHTEPEPKLAGRNGTLV
ncbi:MAG TPA: hypothetical protein VGP88_01535, partial [Thermoplasmata archaeon]|nr:hypothetical protein [Thermoplasmata archaeon]